MEERELLRGERVLEMARLFYQSEKSFNYPYTHATPFHNSREILNFIKLNEPWTST